MICLSEKIKGNILVITAAFLWGVSGIFQQLLLKETTASVAWIITVRLLVSGVALLIIGCFKKQKIFAPVNKISSIIKLVVFGMIGILGMQYTFLAAIEHSNAATAVALQYAYPVIVMLAVIVIKKQKPTIAQIICMFFAISGTFLIATHGNIKSLEISPNALFWGLTSAVCIAFYTVFPAKLIKEYGIYTTCGWGMVSGGLILLIVSNPFSEEIQMNMKSIGYLAITVVLGTLVSFSLYLAGTKKAGELSASIFSTIEPLTIAVLSCTFLKMSFTIIDILGFVLIISTVFVIAIDNLKSQRKVQTTNDCILKQGGNDKNEIPTG